MRYDDKILNAIAALSLVVTDSRLWPDEANKIEEVIRILDGLRQKR